MWTCGKGHALLHHRPSKLRAYQAGVAMIEHAVVISGGGPTGLTLAAELALAGVDVAIVERRSNQDLVGARAGGLHVRTIEVFDPRGIADRFLAVGQKHPTAITFRKIRLNLTDLPSRHNYFLSLWQQETERILAKWVEELGVHRAGPGPGDEPCPQRNSW